MKFGGHDSFYIRENWLSKGLHQVKLDPDQFHVEHAEDAFGVGKNMLKSIIFWMRASRLVDKPRGGSLTLEPLGEMILHHDPFMINPLTWWMVHLNLLTCEQSLCVLPWFFSAYRNQDFDSEELVQTGKTFFKLTKGRKFSESTLRKDISCMINLYVQRDIVSHPEDYYLSPLASLDLVKPSVKPNRYVVHISERTLPLPLIAYAIWLNNRQRFDDSLFDGHVTPEFRLDKIYEVENNPLRLFAVTDDWFARQVLEGTSRDDSIMRLSNLAGHQNLTLRVMDEKQLISAIYR